MAKERYELIIFEKITTKGKTRHKPHRVGNGVQSKGGIALFIPPGLALSGRVLMVPEKSKLSDIDLVAVYQSAADEYGV